MYRGVGVLLNRPRLAGKIPRKQAFGIFFAGEAVNNNKKVQLGSMYLHVGRVALFLLRICGKVSFKGMGCE